MPQSLANIFVHLIFSTAGREPLLKDEWRDELHAYLGGVVRSKGSALLAVNSVTDHIHLLFPLPRTCSMADFVRDLKTSTSNWIEQKLTVKRFHWQTGYGAFSVSGSHKESVEKYIGATGTASQDLVSGRIPEDVGENGNALRRALRLGLKALS